MKLLEQLCQIHAPSGEEYRLTNFLLNYIQEHQLEWKTKPKIYAGDGFQDNIILVFGEPRTAVFAHIDSIGFTVKYNKKLIKIGGPTIADGYALKGFDEQNELILTSLTTVETDSGNRIEHTGEPIDRGTSLSFDCNFRIDEQFVQSCYLDNRLGVWVALQLCKTISHGAIVFSTWEEHRGGSVAYLSDFLAKNYQLSQGLIADITWVTEGVKHGEGVAISLRDSLIPRRSFVNKIIALAKKHKIPHQLEVEDAGGSDGKELQQAAHPWDWCFIGAPEDHVHSPDEKVHRKDIDAMLQLYQVLMDEL